MTDDDPCTIPRRRVPAAPAGDRVEGSHRPGPDGPLADAQRLQAGGRHRFTFRTDPKHAAGFNGVCHSEVLDFEHETMLHLAWNAAPDDDSTLTTTVTFTLEPEGSGTRLFVVHDGFDPDDARQARSRRIMGGGWRTVARRIDAVLAP